MRAYSARQMLRSAPLLAALLTACPQHEGRDSTMVGGEVIAMTGGHGHPVEDFKGRRLITLRHPAASPAAVAYREQHGPDATALSEAVIGHDLRWQVVLLPMPAESLRPIERLQNLPDGCVILEDYLSTEDAHFAELGFFAELPHTETTLQEPGAPPEFEPLMSQRIEVLGSGEIRMEEFRLRFLDRDVQQRVSLRCETERGLVISEQLLDLEAGWNLVQAVTLTHDSSRPGAQRQEQRLKVLPITTRMPLKSTH